MKLRFVVLPYMNADPVLARRLEDAGCATVMPLAFRQAVEAAEKAVAAGPGTESRAARASSPLTGFLWEKTL